MQKFAYVGKYEDGGSQNVFYKLKGRKQGFKGFPNKSLATFAHKAQSALSDKDLAPKVYSPVCKIRVPNYFAASDGKGGMKTITQMVLSDWGYLTEIAKPYECDDDECDGCCLDSCCRNYGKIENLLDDINKCGLEYMDAHPANLGYVMRKNKRVLVVIDLGAESVYSESDSYPSVCWDGAEDMDCSCEQCVAQYDDSGEFEYA